MAGNKPLPPKGEDMVGRYMNEGQNHDDATGSHIAAGKSAGGARVNRKDKAAKGSGTIGTDEWNQNKYGGDGY
jgi:hypothetical protein